jgi:site-specific recombinase XerD
MKAKKHIARLYAFKKNVTKDGLVGLYIAVTINRKTKFISLKISWPSAFYDFEKQEILKRSPRDKEHSDNFLIITQAISNCNEIFVQYRLRDQDLSMERFLEDYYQFNLKKDFYHYMDDKIKKRYRKKDISERTKKNHTNTLNKIRKFHPKALPFSVINVKWCRDFENYLRKTLELKRGTVWTHMKDINTYLNLADEEDNIPVDNPFTLGYNCSAGEVELNALSLAHLKVLTQYYEGDEIPINQKTVLGQFLFSCYTGLRISDLKSITLENIVGDTLVFNPVKGRRFDKIQKIPLTARAKKFIQSEITDRIFEKYVDQSSNRILKKIEDRCGIPFRLTNHVGRHSFATLFLELGGSVEVLQKLMGHTKIATTMKYVHINEKRKEDQMANFDKLDF